MTSKEITMLLAVSLRPLDHDHMAHELVFNRAVTTEEMNAIHRHLNEVLVGEFANETQPAASNPLASLFARLRADGGRYLLSVGMTREERDAQPEPTFGGKGHVRWLTDEEYAALCQLSLPDETHPPESYQDLYDELSCVRGELEEARTEIAEMRSVETSPLQSILEDEDLIGKVIEEYNAPLSWRHPQRQILWRYRDALKSRLGTMPSVEPSADRGRPVRPHRSGGGLPGPTTERPIELVKPWTPEKASEGLCGTCGVSLADPDGKHFGHK